MKTPPYEQDHLGPESRFGIPFFGFCRCCRRCRRCRRLRRCYCCSAVIIVNRIIIIVSIIAILLLLPLPFVIYRRRPAHVPSSELLLLALRALRLRVTAHRASPLATLSGRSRSTLSSATTRCCCANACCVNACCANACCANADANLHFAVHVADVALHIIMPCHGVHVGMYAGIPPLPSAQEINDPSNAARKFMLALGRAVRDGQGRVDLFACSLLSTVDMCVGMCIGMCKTGIKRMCIGMCTDMSIGIYVDV